jgi:spore photoproduct lyase
MIKYKATKTLVTKENKNSADGISPNYIYGCAAQCNYCYMKRYNPSNIYVNTNVEDIEKSVSKWVTKKAWPKVPNQQEPTYYLVDVSCNTDLVLHQKHVTRAYISKSEWENLSGLDYILSFYDQHPKLKATFATKYSSMLNLDVTEYTKPPRVRVSMMPQVFSSVLEPNTTPISQRIKDINRLEKLGWEVHINFSPVIVYDNWQQEYTNLLKEIKSKVDLTKVQSEVIFLTNHNNTMALANPNASEIMKYSNEVKNKSGVMRYPLKYKYDFVNIFKDLISQHLNIPIRYIF